MDLVLGRLTPVLHLTRITTAFGAVANVWLIILWSRAEPFERVTAPSSLIESPLAVVLAGGTAMAVGLFAFGMALNDTIDLRRDRALHPTRPLPSGQMTIEAAMAWVVGALMVAVLGASTLGLPAVVMCLGTAMAILAYNAALRFVPSIGLVLLGMIYGAHAMAANVHLVFIWPVWLAMTHALFAGALTHYLAGTRPALTGRVLAAAILGYLFWQGVLIFVGHWRAEAFWPSEVPAGSGWWVFLLAGAFALLVWRKCRSAGSSRAAADKVQRYAALWLALYATGWMLGAGHHQYALLLAGLAAVGFLGMTVLRELFSLAEHPVGYRR
ncbi:MAG: hypothetical protein AAGB34_07095 [Planctomycetota bacterium]